MNHQGLHGGLDKPIQQREAVDHLPLLHERIDLDLPRIVDADLASPAVKHGSNADLVHVDLIDGDFAGRP